MRTRLRFTVAIGTLLVAAAACTRAAQITGPREPVQSVRTDGTIDSRGPGLLGGGG